MPSPIWTDSYIGTLALAAALWTIPWKLYAVWLAVKSGHKKWFIALLILNTLAILEIFYIFRIAGKSWTDVKADFAKAWKAIKS